jgi:hypothetical protein
MQGGASSSSSCQAADLAAALDAEEQQKRKRCQVRRLLAEFPVYLFIFAHLSLGRSIALSARFSRNWRRDRFVRLVWGSLGGAAAYGVRVLAKTLFVGSEKFGHGENSVEF